MTVAEVAALLKLNQQTIRNWIDGGTLPAGPPDEGFMVNESRWRLQIRHLASAATPFTTAAKVRWTSC